MNISFNSHAFLRRLGRDNCGVGAVEFALVLPVLLIIYLGGVELSHTVTVDRKVTSVTSAVGDLVAQGTAIDDDEMANIFDAARMIVFPYDVATLTMVVTSVDVTEDGDTVIWSDAFHGTQRAEGSEVTLPAGVRIEGTTLIMAEVQYDYVPTLGQMFTDTVHLSDTLYFRPRSVDSVCRNDTC